MAKITFLNDLVLNVEQNGSSFIAENKPIFPDDLSNITIDGEDGVTKIQNGQIVECYSPDGKYWFTIIEKTQEEMLKDQILDLECIISDLLEMM